MYLLKAENATYGINFFTNIDEITPEILERLTSKINLSEYYTVLCNVYKTTLFNLAAEIGGNKSKTSTMSIIPIIAKTTSDKFNIGDRPIIAPTSIERGYQVFIPTAASMSSVIGYLKKFNDLRVQLFQKKYTGNILYNTSVPSPVDGITDKEVIADNNSSIYILDFKIVANSDIVGTIPTNNTINDPCIYQKLN